MRHSISSFLLLGLLAIVSGCAAAMEEVDRGLAAMNNAPAETMDHTIVLTPAEPKKGLSSTFTSPGWGKHDYTKVAIDTRGFRNAELVLNIEVGPQEDGSASFDLLAPETPFTTEGYPQGSLREAYDIAPGTKVTIRYPFAEGRIFKLGAEGSWLNPTGRANAFSLDAMVVPR